MSDDSGRVDFKKFSVVDLFCGIGGLTHGFILEGFKVDAGIDFDKTCRFAYEKNNDAAFHHQDVTVLEAEKLAGLFSKRKILVGCAPCQPFSLYNNKASEQQRTRRSDDDKWKLLHSFADLIEQVEPEIVSMENVPQLIRFNGGAVFESFVGRLRKNGYAVTHRVVNAVDYGVPQRRRRLILFGSKHGEIELLDKTVAERKTVRDAIQNLSPVEDGTADPADRAHRTRKLSELNKKRILATREGGFWREWDPSLWLECHKRESGKTFRSVYGRMVWDEAAPTMTTHCTGLGKGRFGHPQQNRAITLREAALLQSFPPYYDLVDPAARFSMTAVSRHIGNAVPVLLGAVIAGSIKNHIENIRDF